MRLPAIVSSIRFSVSRFPGSQLRYRVALDPLLIAKGQSEIFLLPEMANRHGLIAGATGTGKTVTLQVIGADQRYPGITVPQRALAASGSRGATW